MTPEQQAAYDALEYFVRATGQKQVVCRPLRSNVPDPRPEWVLTQCPKCGCECWKTDLEPDQLPKHVAAACTNCALLMGAKAAAGGQIGPAIHHRGGLDR